MMVTDKKTYNIFSNIPDNTKDEFFETLLEHKNFKLERIVSPCQTTPKGLWLNQETHEWVVLLTGGAKVSFEGNAEPILLLPGDCLHIQPGEKHSVVWTEENKKTIWLALHYSNKNTAPELADANNQQEKEIEKIEIIRTKRRKKTISAKLLKDTMYVYAPYHIGPENLEKIIHDFKRRFRKQMLKIKVNREEDLKKIARELNKNYFSGSLNIKSIEYAVNQTRKFGCCNYTNGSIRISHAVKTMPLWVRDYVLIHELAHLIEPNHSKNFWKHVYKYQLTERARGYLLAKGHSEEEYA